VAHVWQTIVWIFALLGVGLIAFLGFRVLSSGVKDVWRGMASSSWPRTAAEVIRSEVEAERSRDPEDGTASIIYRARLLFAYEVDGRPYTTERVRFGESLGTGDPSEPELKRIRYPEGASLTVVYHPDDPAVAAARPGVSPSVAFAIVAGIVLLVGAVMCLVAVRAMTRAGLGLDDDLVVPVLMGLFASIFILVGGAMLAAGAVNLRDARASRTWPSAQGRILFQKTDATESRVRDAEGQTHEATSFSSFVVYSFAVDGVTHYANKRKFGEVGGGGEERAANLAARYPLGGAVEVRYHPADPDRAVLEPGLGGETWVLPGAGLAFLLFGLAVWAFGIPALTRGG